MTGYLSANLQDPHRLQCMARTACACFARSMYSQRPGARTGGRSITFGGNIRPSASRRAPTPFFRHHSLPLRALSTSIPAKTTNIVASIILRPRSRHCAINNRRNATHYNWRRAIVQLCVVGISRYSGGIIPHSVYYIAQRKVATFLLANNRFITRVKRECFVNTFHHLVAIAPRRRDAGDGAIPPQASIVAHSYGAAR